MRTRLQQPFRRAAWLLLLPLFVAACDVSGLEDLNRENYGLLIELEEIDTPVLVRVYDAATGQLVKKRVDLTITGRDAGTVVDAYSDPTTRFDLSKGRLSFGIQNSVAPTADAPVRFTIRAEADGYLAASQNVRLTEVGDHVVDLYLVSPTRTAEGTATSQTSAQASANGALQQTTAVQTAPEATTQATASVEIGAGTVFKTADGEALTGALTTSLTYYNTSTIAGRRSLPGGTNARLTTGDVTFDVALRPAGALRLDVRDGAGRRAASIDGAASFFIELDPSAINPETGVPYAAGESIGVLSFDEAEGAWAPYAHGVIEASPTGRLGVRVEPAAGKMGWERQDVAIILARLLAIDTTPPPVLPPVPPPVLDWMGSYMTAASPSWQDYARPAPIILNPILSINRNGHTGPIPIQVDGSVVRTFTIPPHLSSIPFGEPFLPSDVVHVRAMLGNGGFGGGFSGGFVPASNTFTLDLPPPAESTITMTAEATFSCKNPSQKIILSDADFFLEYQRTGGDYPSHVIPKSSVTKHKTDNRLSGATLTLDGLVDGATYEISGTILDVSVQHTETAEPSKSFTFEIDHPDVCQ